MQNLEFLETQTVEQFCSEQKVDRIDVKAGIKSRDRNGKPVYYTLEEIKEGRGKAFFVYGAKTGAVSSKGIPSHPMISKVQGDPSAQNPDGIFYLLHDEGNGGAPTLASF